MRKEICHNQEILLLFDGKALCAAGAIVGFQNLKHILLMVRTAHGLPAAINCDWTGTLELTNQPHRVVFVIVHSDETDNALQYLGSKRINVAFPCFGQNTESLRINAFAMLPILTKGRSDASDFPFCMALIEAQAKSGTLGSTLKCDGFRVAAMNFGAQLCTCRM